MDPPPVSLQALETILNEPDSILEPSIESSIGQYIAAGGQVEQIITSLSDSYVGAAELCNFTREVLEHDLNLESSEWETIEQNINEIFIDAFLEGFDPELVDSKYMHSDEGPPQNLQMMVKHRSWRQALYKLAEKYPHCLFINYAIQMTVSLGYQNEIAKVSTASNFLNVFNDIVVNSLSQLDTLLRGSNEPGSIQANMDKLNSLVAEFAKSCCQTEQTYTYTAILLQTMMDESQKSGERGHRYFILKRLLQEMQNYVLHRSDSAMQSEIAKLHYFVTLPASQSSKDAAEAIANIVSAGSTRPGEILLLCDMYNKTGRFQNIPVPEVEYLRNPRFLDILINDLFISKSKISQNHRDRYLNLLAFSIATMQSSATDSEIDKTHFQTTFDAIKKLDNVLLKVDVNGGNVNANVIKTCLVGLMDCLDETALTSSVILKWLDTWAKTNFKIMISILFDPAVQVTPSNSNNAIPIVYLLLDEIAYLHPLLRQQVLQIYQSFMDHVVSQSDKIDISNPQIRTLFNRLVHLVTLGYCLPVLKLFSNQISQTTQSDKTKWGELGLAFLDLVRSFSHPPLLCCRHSDELF
ncbi:TH1 protein, partial [Paraphysoderma sedebokerense]